VCHPVEAPPASYPFKEPAAGQAQPADGPAEPRVQPAAGVRSGHSQLYLPRWGAIGFLNCLASCLPQGDHSQLLDRLSHVYSQLRGPGRATSSSDEEGLPGLMLRGAAGRSTSFAGGDYGSGIGPESHVTRRWAPASSALLLVLSCFDCSRRRLHQRDASRSQRPAGFCACNARRMQENRAFWQKLGTNPLGPADTAAVACLAAQPATHA